MAQGRQYALEHGDYCGPGGYPEKYSEEVYMPPPSETRRHFHGAARGIHAHFETGNFAESDFRL